MCENIIKSKKNNDMNQYDDTYNNKQMEQKPDQTVDY